MRSCIGRQPGRVRILPLPVQILLAISNGSVGVPRSATRREEGQRPDARWGLAGDIERLAFGGASGVPLTE